MSHLSVDPSVAAKRVSLPIALTQGDSAGVGPEIIAMLFRSAPNEMKGCFVVGDVATMRRASACVAPIGVSPLPVAELDDFRRAWSAPPHCIPVFSLPGIGGPQPFGVISAPAGQAAAQAVVWAARAALRSEIAAVVTAPLHKEALHAAGVRFPGHTELLQAEAAAHANVELNQMPVKMMLANDELRTVLLSIHVSLRDAIEAVRKERILEALHITHKALLGSLGRAPHIAVAGLNPHAGEGGLFGKEEIEEIAPAIEAARAQGLKVSGPFAPDTVFMRARYLPNNPIDFDVVLSMYHDQGLIPIKYLGVDRGVNVTLGLPLVRTSPDHGTAFDIAGTGQADPSSFLEAVRLARKLSA